MKTTNKQTKETKNKFGNETAVFNTIAHQTLKTKTGEEKQNTTLIQQHRASPNKFIGTSEVLSIIILNININGLNSARK